MEKIIAGIVGENRNCNSIYLRNLITKLPSLQIKSICAKDDLVKGKAEKYNLPFVEYDEMLADPEIELVIILTPVETHFEIAKAALLAGKNVYTEKTMTNNVKTSQELVNIAKEKNLYLGAAPDSFMGAAAQTVIKAINDGLIGEVTSFEASANRDYEFLLSYYPFLKAPGTGILVDYVGYYITTLTAVLGPVEEVAAMKRNAYPDQKNINPDSPEFGQLMHNDNESEAYAIIRLKNGVMGTFHFNGDSAGIGSENKFIFYGTKGILTMGDADAFGSNVTLLAKGSTEIQTLDLVNSYTDNWRGLGPADMAIAIKENRKVRCNKDRALHVIDTLSAMISSADEHEFKKVDTTCDVPTPLYGDLK